MNLIERYIDEVGKHLPNKTRADIQAEIRSTLEDMLEDRAQQTGQPVDDTLRKAVLAEYGAPEKVAGSYLPERYLIGPKLFPIFSLVLKIVFIVMSVLALVGFGIRFGTSAMTSLAFAEILGKTLLEYLGAIISAFGNIVLIFAILQWALPASEFEDEKQAKSWDPAELEKEPEPDEVRISQPIWAIFFTVAALLIFNLYPQIIGIGYFDGGTWTFVPALTQAFYSYLPWIDALWLLQIVLNIFLLRQGRWTAATRWFDVALNLATIVIAAMLLTGPALVALDVQTLTNLFHDSQSAGALVKIFSAPVPITLVVIIVVESIETILNVYKLLFKPRPVRSIFTR